MQIVTNFEDIHLRLQSTLQELPLWEVAVETESLGNEIAQIFEQEPLMPGVILTKNQHYVGMISRRNFFELMSRPYSLSLFSDKTIETLYNFIKPEVFLLKDNTSITKATQMALERFPQLVYEPIVVESKSGKYGILDIQLLLLAHSQIHVLTLAELQQAQEQSRRTEIALQELQQNYIKIVENEKMAIFGQFVTGFVNEINTSINFIAGNLIHLHRYIQQLFQLINLYQQYYPEPAAEIQTASEQIYLKSMTAEVPQFFTAMKDRTKWIQQLVRTFRDFSITDELEKKAVDLHEGIDITLQVLQSRLQSKETQLNITIIKEYGDIPLVECYPRQLNQVFINILSNAIDALETRANNPKQMPWLRIRTLVTDTNHLAIHIADNGTGMIESVRKQIFNPFFTTKSMAQRTGLGLAISHQIVVEKHGGQLVCISAPGQGAEFIITIPFHRDLK